MTLDPVALLGAVHGPWVYAVVLLAAVLESAAFVGLVVPGETIMLLAGATAAFGGTSLVGVLAVGVVGAVLGDQLGYLLGRTFRDRLREGRLVRRLGPARWARAERLVAERGGFAVFLARWIGVLRALVPAAAGAAGMPRRTFTPWNVAGGTLWATAVALAGYSAGSSWSALTAWMGVGTAVMIGAGAVTATVALVRYVRRRRGTPSEVELLAHSHSSK